MIMVVLTSSLFGLNIEQTKKIKIASNIGKHIVAKDGMTFETALPSIMGQESSWGVFVIGDKWDKNGRLKSVYMSSLGNFQIKLSTAKLTIKKYPKLYAKYKHLVYDGDSIYMKYEKHNAEMQMYKAAISGGQKDYTINKIKTIQTQKDYKKMTYYRGILDNPLWIKRYKAKTKQALSTFKWAKRELTYHTIRYDRKVLKATNNAMLAFVKDTKKFSYHLGEVNKLRAKASKDMRLINRLLTDFSFGAEIGGHYLKSCYNEAVSRGFSNPYKRAIGRYNGGWNNTTYYALVMTKSKTVKKIMRRA